MAQSNKNILEGKGNKEILRGIYIYEEKKKYSLINYIDERKIKRVRTSNI